MPSSLRSLAVLALASQPLLASALAKAESDLQDPYRWLEVVNNSRVMNWVRRQNDRTRRKVGDPSDSDDLPKIIELVQRSPKIPSVAMRGGLVYNYWQDEQHVRGLWRRTSLESFKGDSPAWETVLDLDALANAEGVSWVWKGCRTLPVSEDLCLMELSRGGADAASIREFNLTSKEFVPAPMGFVVPEAKTSISYRDRDSVFIGADCGPGSFTDSGYARTVRIWRRGRDLCSSPVVFEGAATDVSVSAWRSYDWRGYIYDWRSRGTSFYDNEDSVSVVSKEGDASEFVRLRVPSTASTSTFADQLVVFLKSDFAVSPSKTLKQGTVAATPLAAFLAGGEVPWTVLFEPTANRSCDGTTATRNYLVVKVLDAVKGSFVSWKYSDGVWTESRSPLYTATVGAGPVHSQTSDAMWVTSEGFLEPPQLSLAESAGDLTKTEPYKSIPAMFNASGLQVSQQWAVSTDGTRVPYFLVNKKGAPSNQPTILYGYGGFEISLLPRYGKVLGVAWLEKGGAYALANIRGGGEFGPEWHQTAMREGKHKSYEDFAAVAEHLIETGVTSAPKLAAMGGSNGGLLVGNMLVKYPHLFGAIFCSVPLLDMWRYNKLLAGASWMAEYGNPDVPSDWTFLKENSPYHLVDPKKSYPPVLFKTSTRDDRVHPAHARKMAAKLQASVPGSADHVLFYETMEGGHGGGLPSEVAKELVLRYSFLGEALGLGAQGGRARRLEQSSSPVMV